MSGTYGPMDGVLDWVQNKGSGRKIEGYIHTRKSVGQPGLATTSWDRRKRIRFNSISRHDCT